MKKLIIFFLIMFSLFNISGQKKKTQPKSTKGQLTCYLPNGEKYNVNPKTTIGDLDKQFEKEGRVWTAYLESEESIVTFKSFTMEPLYILVLNNKKYSAEYIQNLINSVNDNIVSYRFYWKNKVGFIANLESYIENNILDEQFLLSTMGRPTEIKTMLYGGENTRCFVYKELGFRIFLENDKAIGYERIE
ncbi:hypothetical protein [Chryseobacterium bernardetii]|nr:hypothetical protein [Chryseobacterium bernardetii]